MICYESQDVTGSAGRVTESPELSHDTREKLEKDVRKHYAYSATTLMYPPSANKTTDMLRAMPVDTVIGWLDRQAAITERETKLRELYRFEENHREHVRSIEAVNQELNAQLADAREALDAAWSERDQWRDAYEDSEHMRLELVEQVEYCEALITRLKQRRGELMEQVRKLQDVAARDRLNAQR